jgi:hypothetical protein
MILLDTDHTTFLKYPDSERGRRMIVHLNAVSASEVIGVAIVTVEERMRGWLAVIAKEKSAMRQVVGYRELTLLFEFYSETAGKGREVFRQVSFGDRDLAPSPTARSTIQRSSARRRIERLYRL